MGRRKKEDILLNPTEFDFEQRPKLLTPDENEAIAETHQLLKSLGEENPVLNYIATTDVASFFRFEKEVVIPAEKDWLDRVIGEAKSMRLRISASCTPLTEVFQHANLFSITPEGFYAFNCWTEVEVEYKGVEDPRLRKAVKYP